jgi:multidrug efflux pump subunit AcrB
VKDALARLPGVGDVSLLGARDYSMRVWLDPDKLAARDMTASDVVKALKEQNVQVAAGRIGAPPTTGKVAFQYTVTTLGRLLEPDEFADIVVKTASRCQRSPNGGCSQGRDEQAGAPLPRRDRAPDRLRHHGVRR